ncbi:hypothetical protein HUK84_21165, partial [Nguyenibacter vanlangensis]|nr:hypothetical protein [Nguyenibacter vanlangensis]
MTRRAAVLRAVPTILLFVLPAVGLLGLAALSLAIGRYPVSVPDIVAILSGHDGGMAPARRAVLRAILIQARLPRI